MRGGFFLIWTCLSRKPSLPQSLVDLDASFYEIFWLIPCGALNVQAAVRKHGQNPTVCLFSFEWNGTVGNVNGFRQCLGLDNEELLDLSRIRFCSTQERPKGCPIQSSQRNWVRMLSLAPHWSFLWTLFVFRWPCRYAGSWHCLRKVQFFKCIGVCRPIVCLLSRTCCLLLLMEILRNVREVFGPILLLHQLPSVSFVVSSLMLVIQILLALLS